MADEIHLTDVEILTPAASSGARPGRATTSEPNVAITESFESVFKRDYTPVARMAYLMLGSTGEAREVSVPVSDGATIAWLYRHGEVRSRRDEGEIALLTVTLDDSAAAQLERRLAR